MKKALGKTSILLIILTLVSVHAYSKNYKKLILGKWQNQRFKMAKLFFKKNNELIGIVKFGKKIMYIKGEWKIEDNFLLIRYKNKKQTLIYIIKNITKNVLHTLNYKTFKSGYSKYKQQLAYNEFFLRVKE